MNEDLIHKHIQSILEEVKPAVSKTTFNFTFNGYLLPEEFNGVSNTQRSFSPKYVSTFGETVVDINQVQKNDSRLPGFDGTYSFETSSPTNQIPGDN